MYEFCEEHSIPYERCGKLIVARNQGELGRLDELERRGRENGVPDLRRLSAGELREVEPHAVGAAALHSPHTGIVDFGAVARSLAPRELPVVTSAGVESVAQRAGRVVIGHTRGETAARYAVFCAGAASDRLAVLAGAPPDPRIVPFRGTYQYLKPSKRELVRGMIYPVPDPSLPFLGVHLTRHIDGQVSLGPSALLWPRAARDLTWPGTWRMARRWWRTGLTELRHAVSRRSFAVAGAGLRSRARAGRFRGRLRRGARTGARPRRRARRRLHLLRDRARPALTERALPRRDLIAGAGGADRGPRRTAACFKLSATIVTPSSSTPEAISIHDPASAEDRPPELSVVMPCLNEADTLATCIGKAQRAMASTGSPARSSSPTTAAPTARRRSRVAEGARVVPVAAARLRQRADGRHRRRARPLRHHGRRRRQLRLPRAAEVRRPSCARATTSCRAAGWSAAAAGAARARCRCCIGAGATRCSRRWPDPGSGRRSTTSTAACGASPRSTTSRLDQRCTGMEFATEMIIKSSLHSARIAEVPITLHPDGRKAHAPHLRTFRDGWRTLRFFLLYSPRWLFLVPGLAARAARARSATRSRCRRVDASRRHLRRAHAAVREPGAHLRLPVDPVRGVHQGLRHQRGAAAARPACRAARRARARSRQGLIGGAPGLLVGLVLLALAVNKWRVVRTSASSTTRARCGWWSPA